MEEYERQWLAKQIDELAARLESQDLTEQEREYAEQERTTYRQWLKQLEEKKDKQP